ncbi:MAG: hypothetical protein RIR97_1325 [Pseudomonadota bacterium]
MVKFFIEDEKMTRLEKLTRSVEDLNAEELKAFTRWFDDVRAKRFDAAIEQDIAKGSLDVFAEEALADYRAGRARSL